jgi:predicted NUDIX family phosphoesterase
MSRRVDDSLGIKRMPKGYALMLDDDEVYFYWRCEDGRESAIHWNKWAVWRGAMADAQGRAKRGEKGSGR